MPEVVTWAAMFTATVAIIALITFWVNRGKVEGELEQKASNALNAAVAASAKAELLSQQLNEVRVEFAKEMKEYATHKDVAAAENRMATTMDGVRQEMRGLNQRFDRLFDRFAHAPDGG